MKKCIFIISLSLLSLVGCEKKYDRTIWVNPDVECCGVKDPLNNLEWISQTPRFKEYQTASYSYSNYILLFQKNTTHEDFIIFKIKDEINYVIIYDCNGNVIDGGAYNYTNSNKIDYIKNNYRSELPGPPKPCYICDTFFKTHTLTDTIAYFNVEH